MHFPLHCQFSWTLQLSLKPLFHLTSNWVVKFCFFANIPNDINSVLQISFLTYTHWCGDYRVLNEIELKVHVGRLFKEIQCKWIIKQCGNRVTSFNFSENVTLRILLIKKDESKKANNFKTLNIIGKQWQELWSQIFF